MHKPVPPFYPGQIVYLKVDYNAHKRGQPLEVLGDSRIDGKWALSTSHPPHIYVKTPGALGYFTVDVAEHVSTEPVEPDADRTERVEINGTPGYVTYGDVNDLDEIPEGDDTEPVDIHLQTNIQIHKLRGFWAEQFQQNHRDRPGWRMLNREGQDVGYWYCSTESDLWSMATPGYTFDIDAAIILVSDLRDQVPAETLLKKVCQRDCAWIAAKWLQVIGEPHVEPTV